MEKKIVNIKGIEIGGGNPIVLIAGPCVIESKQSALKHAREIKRIAEDKGVPFIYKSSFDKANRSSIDSYRGPGIEKGLQILREIKEDTGLAVLSDIHSEDQVDKVKDVLDVIQIPAFLCRQTDLVVAAGKTGKPVNIKKGQFMSAVEMENVIAKVKSTGNDNIMLTERGTAFGYNTLVNDFRSLVVMRETGYPVIYDATHSVQKPGGKGTCSGGESKYVVPLSKAAVACGIDALFLEVHEDPDKALSDGPNMVKLSELGLFLDEIKKVEKAVK